MKTDDFLATYRSIEDARSFLPQHPSRKWKQRGLDELHGLVLHQSRGSASVDSVARYHVNPNHISPHGLPGISYTFFVEPDGRIMLCNALEDITYSQGDRTKPGDENRMFVSCCLGGDFDAPGYTGTTHLTTDQMRGALELWSALRKTFGWDDSGLYGHYHFGKAGCPGTIMQTLIDSVRAGTAASKLFDSAVARQQALARLGYYKGVVDGIWGMHSRRALERYQSSRSLTVDGIWGQQTETAIRNDIA